LCDVYCEKKILRRGRFYVRAILHSAHLLCAFQQESHRHTTVLVLYFSAVPGKHLRQLSFLPWPTRDVITSHVFQTIVVSSQPVGITHEAALRGDNPKPLLIAEAYFVLNLILI